MKLYDELKTNLQRLNAADPLTKSLDEQLNYLIYGEICSFVIHDFGVMAS